MPQSTPPQNNDPADFAKKLTLLHTLKGHSLAVSGIVISQGTRIIVSGSFDGTIKIWNAMDGILLRTITPTEATDDEFPHDSVLSVALSPDARTIVSGQWHENTKVWNTVDGTLLRTLEGPGGSVGSVAFSPDGRTLYVACWDIHIWNALDGTLLHTLKGHKGKAICVALSPDGRTVVSGSSDETIKVWNALDGVLLCTLKDNAEVHSVAISPDSRTIVTGNIDKTIKVWNALDGTLLHTLKGHKGKAICVALSPDGRTIASGGSQHFSRSSRSGGREKDKTIKIWNALDGTLLRTLKAHPYSVERIAFSPDGRTIVSGSGDGTIKVWGMR